jgi:hypothetical protein
MCQQCLTTDNWRLGYRKVKTLQKPDLQVSEEILGGLCTVIRTLSISLILL